MSVIGELLVPGIMVVFGVIYFFSMRGLPQESTVFPYVLMVLMPILVVLILVQEFHRGRGETASEAEKDRGRIAAPGVVFLGSIGYLVIFSLSHFVVASFVFMAFIMIYFGIKPAKSFIVSAVFTGAMYVVFGQMFFVDL
jgi:hypothetical protein